MHITILCVNCSLNFFFAFLQPQFYRAFAMPKILWTVEKAREAGLKSVAVRRQRKLELEQAPVFSPVQAEASADVFSASLALACDETLAKLRRAAKPIERAQLARCLRDLRETWHLATGKPKPPVAKQEPVKRREIPRAYPAAYNPNGVQ